MPRAKLDKFDRYDNLHALSEGGGGWQSGVTPYLAFDMDDGTYTYRGVSYADFDAWWTAVQGSYTRSGTKRYVNASKVLVSVGANVWPTEYDITTGRLIGKSVWPTYSTIRGTSRRDLTNAAWTSTSVTAAKDQTGIDGSANAASSIVATGANGTCLQAISDATSRARGFNAFIKRLVGTGTIEATLDGGTTWYAVTTELADAGSNWYRVHVATGSNIANPSMGFRIGTSGDKIAVDYTQLVDSTLGAPPILEGETYTVDLATITIANVPEFNDIEGTVAVKVTPQSSGMSNVGSSSWALSIDNGTSGERITMQKSANNSNADDIMAGSVTQFSASFGSPVPSAVEKDSYWYGMRWKANDARNGANGQLGTQDTSVTVPARATTIRLGLRDNGGNAYGGGISGLRIYRRAHNDNALIVSTSGTKPAITRGDSLSTGTAGSVKKKCWPWLIHRRSASFLSTTLILGVGGTTSTQALATAQSDGIGQDGSLVALIWTGHNDPSGIVPATTKANIAAIAALHPRYVIGTILRGPTSVDDASAHAADKAEVNAWIIATYPNNYVDLNQAVLDNGGDALYADTIHLNDAGQVVAATAWSTKLNALGW